MDLRFTASTLASLPVTLFLRSAMRSAAICLAEAATLTEGRPNLSPTVICTGAALAAKDAIGSRDPDLLTSGDGWAPCRTVGKHAIVGFVSTTARGRKEGIVKERKGDVYVCLCFFDWQRR